LRSESSKKFHWPAFAINFIVLDLKELWSWGGLKPIKRIGQFLFWRFRPDPNGLAPPLAGDNGAMGALEKLQARVEACELCPRLRAHCQKVAKEKRRAYRDQAYWGKPVPSFGDPAARLLIVGLAPGAHGANRTGRMFTGDASGDFLYSALHATGWASQPTSVERGDGLQLVDCYITAAGRCAPPGNKPMPGELRTCRQYLEQEIQLLRNLRVVVALGRIAFDTCLHVFGAVKARHQFGHGWPHELHAGNPLLISSYHPSQQNTSTGKLTQTMLRDVFTRAQEAVAP
jgi:uracil-DNA glycosylase